MTIDITKFKLGPCNVYLEENSVDVLIGGTGPVELTVKQTWQGVGCDQLGTEDADAICSGSSAEVTIPMREITLENFTRALKASAKTFVDDTTPTKRRFEFGQNPGAQLSSFAKKLTLKPLVGGVETTDKELIITFDKAAPKTETLKLVLGATGQREITAVFAALPNTAKNNRLFFIGDDTAVDVTPTIGIPFV